MGKTPFHRSQVASAEPVILKAIRNAGPEGITTKELMAISDRSSMRVRRICRLLLEEGRVEKVGTMRNTRWRIA